MKNKKVQIDLSKPHSGFFTGKNNSAPTFCRLNQILPCDSDSKDLVMFLHCVFEEKLGNLRNS